ncbi:MAG TPA: glutathione peroxidase [Hyphomicrobiaceae bacterium]|nr:glutathione peroxidase [Hyphomicrobiaceae bacterium]
MRTYLIAAAALAVACAMVVPQAVAADSAKPVAYDFSFEAIEGGAMPLAAWRGKVLLIVNTASFCGFTPQYEGLQALWQRYQAQGLIVLGVPSNDFGGQEPKSEAEILGFCKGAYNVSFPLSRKEVVSGRQAHPFYRWARDRLGARAAPSWNFHKYLVGRDGHLIAAFDTRIPPLSPEVVAAIEAALAR